MFYHSHLTPVAAWAQVQGELVLRSMPHSVFLVHNSCSPGPGWCHHCRQWGRGQPLFHPQPRYQVLPNIEFAIPWGSSAHHGLGLWPARKGKSNTHPHLLAALHGMLVLLLAGGPAWLPRRHSCTCSVERASLAPVKLYAFPGIPRTGENTTLNSKLKTLVKREKD